MKLNKTVQEIFFIKKGYKYILKILEIGATNLQDLLQKECRLDLSPSDGSQSDSSEQEIRSQKNRRDSTAEALGFMTRQIIEKEDLFVSIFKECITILLYFITNNPHNTKIMIKSLDILKRITIIEIGQSDLISQILKYY